ncbi:MAG: replication protein A [Marinobacter sp. T13-3]|nr:MAG: replication protein A [Marinobacter sp. T13-3]
MPGPSLIPGTTTPITRAVSQAPESAMARILSEAPYLPRCSDNKTAALSQPRRLATRFPYMQVNRRDVMPWLVFDIDYRPNGLPWESAGLPTPNLMVRNRDTGHCHLFYAIVPVITGPKGRDKPIRFLRSVYEAMAGKMKADPQYRGPVAKTPGHPWWDTTEFHSHVYSLGELADYLTLPVYAPWAGRSQCMEDADHGDSRHWKLFRRICCYAYQSVQAYRRDSNYEAFEEAVYTHGQAINREVCKPFPRKGLLRLSQVRAVCKSVARWTWLNYTGSGRWDRGVMELDRSLPLSVRQSLAAHRTHGCRRQATERRIAQACRNLQAEGRALTFVAIAHASGLTRQTVAKYRTFIDSLTAPAASSDTRSTQASKKEAVCANVTDVNFTAHKITTVVGEHSTGLKGLAPSVCDHHQLGNHGSPVHERQVIQGDFPNQSPSCIERSVGDEDIHDRYQVFVMPGSSSHGRGVTHRRGNAQSGCESSDDSGSDPPG